MPATEKMICIICPMGCHLAVTREGVTVLRTEGNRCKKGLTFAEAELRDPRRMVATTVRVKGAVHPLVPVHTEKPFPKPRIFDLLREIRQLEVEAPVMMNQVLLEDALGEGINVIASREMLESGA